MQIPAGGARFLGYLTRVVTSRDDHAGFRKWAATTLLRCKDVGRLAARAEVPAVR